MKINIKLVFGKLSTDNLIVEGGERLLHKFPHEKSEQLKIIVLNFPGLVVGDTFS